MPCVKCSNGKWRLGSGKCMYTSLEKCKKAEQAYHASKKETKDGKSLSEMDTERRTILSDDTSL